MEPDQVTAWLKVVQIGSRIFGPAFSRISKRKEAGQLQEPQTATEIVDDLEDTLEMVQDQLQRFEESGSSNIAKRTFEYQQTQNLASGIATVKLASEILGDDPVPNVEPDYELYSRIFGDVADVSTEDKRIIYAKILAGEVKQPGSTSLKTLSILRDMDQSTASQFRRLCSLAVSARISDDQGAEHVFDVRVPSLGTNAANNSLSQFGLSFDILNVLNEHGLIIGDYNSYHNFYNFAILNISQLPVLPFHYQNSNWILTPNDGYDHNQELNLHGVALTKAGKELSLVVDVEMNDDYTAKLNEFFNSRALNMVKLPVQGN